MPAPLNLLKGMEKGYEVKLPIITRVSPNDMRQPPLGKVWMVLYGEINHVTGTETVLGITDDKSGAMRGRIATAKAADANGSFPLWHPSVGAYGLYVLSHPQWINLSQGDAAATAIVTVLEWDQQ